MVNGERWTVDMDMDIDKGVVNSAKPSGPAPTYRYRDTLSHVDRTIGLPVAIDPAEPAEPGQSNRTSVELRPVRELHQRRFQYASQDAQDQQFWRTKRKFSHH